MKPSRESGNALVEWVDHLFVPLHDGRSAFTFMVNALGSRLRGPPPATRVTRSVSPVAALCSAASIGAHARPECAASCVLTSEPIVIRRVVPYCDHEHVSADMCVKGLVVWMLGRARWAPDGGVRWA